MTYARYERFCIEGVEVLSCRISLTVPDELQKISEFYRDIGENAYEYASSALLAEARQAFERDTDDKKRFHFKAFRYELCSETTYDSEELISVKLSAFLTRRGEKGASSAFCDGQVWEKKKERLLPPKLALRARGEKIKMSKRVDSVLLLSDGAAILKGGKWERLK